MDSRTAVAYDVRRVLSISEAFLAYGVVFLAGLLALRAWTDSTIVRGKSAVKLALLGLLASLVAVAIEAATILPLGLKRRLSHITLQACIAGGVEELCKAGALFIALRKQPRSISPRAMVACAFFIALALATLESIAKVKAEMPWDIVAARSFVSIPGHLAYLGCIAVFAARRAARGWAKGIAAAAAAHALYDWLGLIPQLFETRLPFDWPFRIAQVTIVYGLLTWLARTLDAMPQPDPVPIPPSEATA